SEGRIDFVELKFLRATQPWLTGEIRKLVLVKNFQSLPKDWHEAEAFTLGVLPQELVFLHPEIFRCPKSDLLAWLINLGHRLTGDLVTGLRSGNSRPPEEDSDGPRHQLPLTELRTDDVAQPLLEKSASLESTVEVSDDK